MYRCRGDTSQLDGERVNKLMRKAQILDNERDYYIIMETIFYKTARLNFLSYLYQN